MPLNFQPRAGAVVRCNFHGMIEPEMVKLRDVVVVAQHKQNAKLVTVIPLSTTQPARPQPYHYELPSDPRPDGDPMRPVWAKCDMVYTVCLERLDVHYTRTRRGGRQSQSITLPRDVFKEIKKRVAIALGLSNNEGVPTWDLESGSASA